MVEKDLISIVTVTYNCEEVLEDTIHSVISQTYSNIEYIIIDGNSSDGTLDIIQKYESHLSTFISEPDKGIYDAMNKGIEHAHGKWINFMNAGDTFYSKDAVTDFVSNILNDTVIAYGDSMIWLKDVHYLRPHFSIDCLKMSMCIPHQSTFVRTDYHKKNLFDISFHSSGDFDFFHRAYVFHNVRFQYIPMIVSNFDGETGMSKDNYEIVWKEDRLILGKSICGWHALGFRLRVILKSLKNRIKKFIPSNYNRKLKQKNLCKKGIVLIKNT